MFISVWIPVVTRAPVKNFWKFSQQLLCRTILLFLKKMDNITNSFKDRNQNKVDLKFDYFQRSSNCHEIFFIVYCSCDLRTLLVKGILVKNLELCSIKLVVLFLMKWARSARWDDFYSTFTVSLEKRLDHIIFRREFFHFLLGSKKVRNSKWRCSVKKVFLQI